MDLLAAAENKDKCRLAVDMLQSLIDADYKLYAVVVSVHPKAGDGWKDFFGGRPHDNLMANCMWYYKLEEKVKPDFTEYKMGYWSDILAVAPGHSLPQ
jgi:hypothetical protein